MSLPWVRLDTGIASHDKILALLADPSPKRWQAAFSYVSSLAWSGDHGTDGRVKAAALPFVHGSKATAALLAKYDLWDVTDDGWQIRNYLARQQSSLIGEEIRAAQQTGSKKGNCVRWHGKDCGCWREAS